MKAEIEIGRRPDAFWQCVAAMVGEHSCYYAAQNAFGGIRAMFGAMVDAYNRGQGHAARLAITGASGDVLEALETDGGVADVSMGVYGVVSSSVTGGRQSGADWALYGAGREQAVECSWTTSGGNMLTAQLDGEWFTVIVEGRRHGIPWRFLQYAGVREHDLLVVAMDSESTAKPWCDGTGKPLARFDGRVADNLAGVGVDPLPGQRPSWADAHQQAGWAADKVQDADAFLQFCRTCAKYAIPSTAVSYAPSQSMGVFRLSAPAWSVNWQSSRQLWRKFLEVRRDCSVPVKRHDGGINWSRLLAKHEACGAPIARGDLESLAPYMVAAEELACHRAWKRACHNGGSHIEGGKFAHRTVNGFLSLIDQDETWSI